MNLSMRMIQTATVANDTPRWTARKWREHVADHHPSHAAASYAKHREEMGDLRPAALVITALSMVSKTVTKDGAPLSYEDAVSMIESACDKRAAKRVAA